MTEEALGEQFNGKVAMIDEIDSALNGKGTTFPGSTIKPICSGWIFGDIAGTYSRFGRACKVTCGPILILNLLQGIIKKIPDWMNECSLTSLDVNLYSAVIHNFWGIEALVADQNWSFDDELALRNVLRNVFRNVGEEFLSFVCRIYTIENRFLEIVSCMDSRQQTWAWANYLPTRSGNSKGLTM